MVDHITRLGQTVAIALVSTSLLATSSVLAASLKEHVQVYSHYVLASDLFDGLDENQDEALFLSPDIGQSGKVSATRIVEEANNVGIYNINPDHVKSVTVERPSLLVSRDDIIRALRKRIKRERSQKIDFELTTTSIPKAIHTDPREETPWALANFKFSENETRFESTVIFKGFEGKQTITVRGVLIEMTRAVSLSRDLEREDILTESDLTILRLPKTRVRQGSITNPKAAIGKAALRRLNQGSILRGQDIAEPVLIRSNDAVTISYSIPGLILTAQGRALASGAQNETILVRNLQSNRVIRGRVTGVGEVKIIPRNASLAAKDPNNKTKVQ